MDTKLNNYSKGDKYVQEGIELALTMPYEQSAEYMRIYEKRPPVFWDACKVTNDTTMREYVDLRRLAKSIRAMIFPDGKKGPRKRAQD